MGMQREGRWYLEVGVHVQPSGAKVVGPGDVWDNTLPVGVHVRVCEGGGELNDMHLRREWCHI